MKSRAWREGLVLDSEAPLFHYDGAENGCGCNGGCSVGAIIRGDSCLIFSRRQKMHSLLMAFHHLSTRKIRVLRFPLDEVGLMQSNKESCQWRMWQESARVSNSLSSYVQIDNYEASPPVEPIKILLVRKPAHV